MLFVRVAVAAAATLLLAAAVVLNAVALIAPWWATGPTAPDVGGAVGAEEDRLDPKLVGPAGATQADALNSEITLWAHVGCAKQRNETWQDICALTDLYCFLYLNKDEDEEEEDPAWRPPPPLSTIATTSGAPTIDPYVSTTPKSETTKNTDNDCAEWGVGCVEDWGKLPTRPGEDGIAFGDAPDARINHGGTSTQDGDYKPPPVMAERTTTTAIPPDPTYGKNPFVKEDENGMVIGEEEKKKGFLEALWDSAKPEAEGFEPDVNNEFDERAVKLVPTTTTPALPAGVEEAIAYCPLARDEQAATKLLCGLRTQCGQIAQVRMGMMIAVVASGLALLAQFAFGAGGGGLGKDGEMAPSKHVPGLIAAGLSAASVLALGFAFSAASGVEVPHVLEGPGAMCALAALVVTPFAGSLAAGAAFLAFFFPTKPPGMEEDVREPLESELEPEQLEELRKQKAILAYPGLARDVERPLALRSAWVPPPHLVEMAQAAIAGRSGPPIAPAGEAPPTMAVPTTWSEVEPHEPAVTSDEEALPSEVAPEAAPVESVGPLMLCLPPMRKEVAPSPATEQALQRFYEGEGAVCAQRLFATSTPAPPSAASSTLGTARGRGGWEVARSPRSGDPYYFRRDSGEIQWEVPAEWEEAEAREAPPMQLPGSPMTTGPTSAWKKKRCKRTGQVFSVKRNLE